MLRCIRVRVGFGVSIGESFRVEVLGHLDP
jgi:hypothetical protein